MEFLSTWIDTYAARSLASPAYAFPAYALAGMAGSLFPCVYPIFPIAAGIVRMRSLPGENRVKHPLLFWTGMVVAYSVLGVLAALGGGAFNAVMQSGPAIVLSGFLFLFLVTVTLDWHPLSFPAADRLYEGARHRAGGFFTIIMGIFAALVASACVAPALVTMLIFLAKQSTANVSSILYGAGLSGAFGLGIGMPFFLIGVIGVHLPREGRLRIYVKYGFALVIAGAALYQLDKGFRTMGFATMDIAALFGGVLCVALAVLLGLRFPANTNEITNRPAKIKFFFAVILLLFGAGMFIRAFVPKEKPDTAAAIGPIDEASAKKENVGNLVFYREPEFALRKARAEKKAVFIDFYADWCANCKDFSKLVVADTALNQAMKDAVLVKIYDSDPSFKTYQEDDRFPELRIGLPFFLVFTPAGNFHWKSYNYKDTQGMIGALTDAARK